MGCVSVESEAEYLEYLKRKDKEFEDKMVKRAHPYYFYNALYQDDVDLVRRFLEAGSEPNKCRGENGWVDSNPLKVAAEGFYNTFDFRNNVPKDNIPEPAPDVEIIQLLVSAGADVNRLPYIWDRVYRYSEPSNLPRDPVVAQLRTDAFVKDANRVLSAFLEAGADPDKLGHPFPFGYDWKVPFLTDKKANKYFMQGTRAINIAIEKGIVWESQVDLLLQYTKLDEESLKAAERSNDPAMMEKINRLWEIQQDKIVYK